MAGTTRASWRHLRWPHVLALVVLILTLVTYLNIASHRSGAAQTRTASLLGDLDLLLHEESDLQWKTLADRSAPVRVAREVGAIRARERQILTSLAGTLPDARRTELRDRVERYHTVLDKELALLVVGRTDEAKELEWRQTEPQFAQLSSTILALSRAATSKAASAARTADLTLIAAMVLSSVMIGALLRRFERAHRAAVQASGELLRQERIAVQQAQASAATIRHQAEHDALTGLPNRVLFSERVAAAIDSGADAAVLFVDLDDFKRVNDGLGHAVGDELLTEVASRLRASARATDTAARLGGDEFAVLIADGGIPGATGCAERFIAALREPIALGGTHLLTHASVGIAAVGPHRDTAELLRNADVAMYAAKSQGKGQFAVFEAAMDERVRGRVDLEIDLRKAIEDGALYLEYQPIVGLAGGTVVGAEALVRWRHPVDGPLEPSQFLPVAEETGLILPLGQWVLREACRQACEWITAGLVGQFTINVNLSARQLHHPDIVEDTVAVLRETGLDPAALILEITESAMLRDHRSVASKLDALRALGVRIALDDFGTGYSSLSHLQQFSVDQLKLDQSFVTAGSEIGAAIIRLGHALGLDTVAEGVETREQADRMRELGCRFAQGHWFARPLEPAAFAAVASDDGEAVVSAAPR